MMKNESNYLCTEELKGLNKETLIILIDQMQKNEMAMHSMVSDLFSSITAGQIIQSRLTTAEMMLIIRSHLSQL